MGFWRGGAYHRYTKPFEGVLRNLQRRWQETDSVWVREELARIQGLNHDSMVHQIHDVVPKVRNLHELIDSISSSKQKKLLPVIRNTYTGIMGVDPNVREAARGMGLTDWQLLWHVELPLALGVILAMSGVGAVLLYWYRSRGSG